MELQFEQTFFDTMNRLRYYLKMPMIHGRNGSRKAMAKGASVEFSDYREYQLGDDIRRVDWNAYGRFEKLYIKEYMEEKEALFHLFLDTSGSMEFGNKKKSDLALYITAGLSYLILNNLDRAQVYKIADGGQVKGKKHGGRGKFSEVLQELKETEFGGKTDLASSLRASDLTKGGISIVISDFLDIHSMETAIQYLKYKKQEVIFICIWAKEEEQIASYGDVEFLDMETKERLKVTITRKEVEAYQERLHKYQRQLEQLCKKYDVAFIKVYSHEPFDEVLLKTLYKSQLL